MNDLESVSNLREQLVAIEAFVKTAAFRSYKSTIASDIKSKQDNILMLPPTDAQTIALSNQLHGAVGELQNALTFFEDAQATLNERIRQIEDAESKAPDNNEQNDN